jgi:predicted phage terminase large subunit-like protein
MSISPPLKHAPWLDDFIREITAFPGSRYDDQVDSTSQALEFLETKCRLKMYDVV